MLTKGLGFFLTDLDPAPARLDFTRSPLNLCSRSLATDSWFQFHGRTGDRTLHAGASSGKAHQASAPYLAWHPSNLGVTTSFTQQRSILAGQVQLPGLCKDQATSHVSSYRPHADLSRRRGGLRRRQYHALCPVAQRLPIRSLIRRSGSGIGRSSVPCCGVPYPAGFYFATAARKGVSNGENRRPLGVCARRG